MSIYDVPKRRSDTVAYAHRGHVDTDRIAFDIDAYAKRVLGSRGDNARPQRAVRQDRNGCARLSSARRLMQQPDIPPKRISIEEFGPILMASEVKLELVDGKIVPFANGTVAHSLVCERVVQLLRRVAQPGCDVFTSQFGLRFDDGSTYVFPDATYTCEGWDPDETIAAPRLIVEVMSPLSVERDRVDKVDIYLRIPTIQEYFVIDSRRPWAGMYRRSDRGWQYTNYGPGDTIELRSIGGERFDLSTFYAADPDEQ